MHMKSHDQFSAIGALDAGRVDNLNAAEKCAKEADVFEDKAGELRRQEAVLRALVAEQEKALAILRSAGFELLPQSTVEPMLVRPTGSEAARGR